MAKLRKERDDLKLEREKNRDEIKTAEVEQVILEQKYNVAVARERALKRVVGDIGRVVDLMAGLEDAGNEDRDATKIRMEDAAGKVTDLRDPSNGLLADKREKLDEATQQIEGGKDWDGHRQKQVRSRTRKHFAELEQVIRVLGDADELAKVEAKFQQALRDLHAERDKTSEQMREVQERVDNADDVLQQRKAMVSDRLRDVHRSVEKRGKLQRMSKLGWEQQIEAREEGRNHCCWSPPVPLRLNATANQTAHCVCPRRLATSRR